MPIFFEAPPKPASADLEQSFIEALEMDPITMNVSQRRDHARGMVTRLPKQPPQAPTVIWWRVVVAFVLLAGLFGAAVWFANNNQPKLSETLLHWSELLFTATLGLLGIEAAKHG